MKNKINVVISKDAHGYYAYCPALPGCQTQGDTFEETMVYIREAIELYLETMTPEEIEESLSQEILTTTMEVQVA
ncbi:MAG: type II toxin-antitoxin system HicB family antitoxin [Symploca sp. SIO1C4]|uniref:Type II toxin-antitoxin system HicB family antitoxin n=1 Tax=Symploca sp. SIO1C4 TaxID=2607765 RepID=A0A6B3NN96_9CYAN|nr:type II toxin-antitoxin system HicB family antitoxin [Symploca sp. SIO1C4]